MILQKEKILLTGSSRTDAGVHALQNFFHGDFELPLNERFIYKINAILPRDIVLKKVLPVEAGAHCRFDAIAREYKYFIYREKDPFREDRAFYFPYRVDREAMMEAASAVMGYQDFTSFSKRNTQVKTFKCNILESEWVFDEKQMYYHVSGDRFLRGMVRAMTATMLKVGRGKITLQEFRNIIEAKDCTRASFAVPPQGLFLISVKYPVGYLA
jgi:tRNA pseudouridine38-40 synthase